MPPNKHGSIELAPNHHERDRPLCGGPNKEAAPIKRGGIKQVYF